MELDEIIEHLNYAQRYENYIVSQCPFHDDRRPSFFVYPDRYRCESCGANGWTSKLLEKLGHAPVTHVEAPNF
ncbi:MAG: CHC2 zinc finger domain-containing protein, partial [Candidatus Hodarchaeales archaeon]